MRKTPTPQGSSPAARGTARTSPGGVAIPAQPTSGWGSYDQLLNDLVRDLPGALGTGILSPPQWQPIMIYLHAWTNATGTAAYCKYAGIVWLRGGIVGGATGTVAFTLPKGFRPGVQDTYPAITNGSVAGANISVDSLGNVTPQIPTAGFAAFLTAVRFIAEN